MSKYEPFDGIDALFFALLIIGTASTVIWASVPLLLLFISQYVLRRSQLMTYIEDKPLVDKLRLLPAIIDQDQSITIDHRHSGSIDVNVSTKPIVYKSGKIPAYIPYRQMPKSKDPFDVPLGFVTNTKSYKFVNIRNQIYHALIAGTSGVGKEGILKNWFVSLTSQNTPDDVQFVIIDGKGEWLTDPIKASAFMFLPPTGGTDIEINDAGKIINVGKAKMQTTVVKVVQEIKRRSELFNSHNVVNIDRYNEKTNNKLPYIIIIMTDVSTDLEDELSLLVDLISAKARSLGLRLWMSMQTPVGQSTKWRTNIGFRMTGKLEPNHDHIVLGMPVLHMQVRPSSLPTPIKEDPSTLGLFITVFEGEQLLVKVPHITDRDFEDYTANSLLSIYDWHKKPSRLLTSLLQDQPSRAKRMLSSEEREKIAIYAAIGNQRVTILKKLGITNEEDIKDVLPEVTAIITRVKNSKKAL